MTPERPTSPNPEQEPFRLTFDAVRQEAIDRLLQTGQHPPLVIAEGKLDGLVLEIPEMGSTHEERMKQMAITGFAMAHHGNIGDLRQVFFISEAWMGKAVGDVPFIPPSQDPQRIEVLSIANRTVVQPHTHLLLLEMRRDSSGHLTEVRHLHETGDKDGFSAESPLLEAFVFGFQTR